MKNNSSIRDESIINKDPLNYFTHGLDVMWYLENNKQLLNQVYDLEKIRSECIQVLNKLISIEENVNPRVRAASYSNWAFISDQEFRKEVWFEIIYFLNRVLLESDESNLFSCMVMNGLENDLYVLTASNEFWSYFYEPMSRSIGFEILTNIKIHNEYHMNKLSLVG